MTESTSSISVLCVDDEPGMADLIGAYLKRFGGDITATPTTSPQAALDIFDPEEYDCIVSDYDMQGTDGLQFLAIIRAEYPDFPFVLFTGRGSEEIASEAISAGVTDYMQKEQELTSTKCLPHVSVTRLAATDLVNRQPARRNGPNDSRSYAQRRLRQY